MRVRFCATMRKPARSIISLIAPVKLRAVASGLMIEKVRSIAMASFFKRGKREDVRPGRLIAMASEHGKVRTRDPERNGAGKSEPPMNRTLAVIAAPLNPPVGSPD